MSVLGGDSWGREAQYRKRRLNDLLLDSAAGDEKSYRKLPSGKYACLVCPHKPVLDTPLILSRALQREIRKPRFSYTPIKMHLKAKRHLDAETRAKQREEERQNEVNKRIALSVDSTSLRKTDGKLTKQREEERQNEMNKRIALSVDSTSLRKTDGKLIKRTNLASKPLIEKTQKAVFEVLHHSYPEQGTSDCSQSRCPVSAPCDLTFGQREVSGKDVVQMPLDYRERRGRELKFTAAGWKRDCNGGWFRDENVEFDSDEEDPNLSLANGQ